MENCPPDRFKPLQNLINGKTKNPDVLTVELLAWLLHFRHRPYRFDMDVELSQEERAVLNKWEIKTKEDGPTTVGIELSDVDEEPQTPSGKKEEEASDPMGLLTTEKGPKRKRTMEVSLLFAAAIFLAGYLFWKEQRVAQMAFMNKAGGCMYWTGEHYEEAPCNEGGKDRVLFPMDVEKMKRFKRITQIDTITARSIRKIYYIRINGGIEYFTAGGHHPVHITRKLQPLSTYMFETHLAKDAGVNESQKWGAK